MIEQIKDIIPIVDVLIRYAGVQFPHTNRRRFNIRCPYHNDKTPSFTVYTDTNTFRCWGGCNDGRPGDAINIVQLSNNLDAKEAIKQLIYDFGLENPDSAQIHEWRERNAQRQQIATLSNELDKKVNETMSVLKRLEKSIKHEITLIKTLDNLDVKGDLIHLVPQIDYWLDCLIDNNPIIQFETLQETKRFIDKISTKGGEAE